MKVTLKTYGSVLTAIGVLWCTVGILVARSIAGSQGHLFYALDDPYIHMAMAKNLALHGVWGVTRYAFSSSASSLLWPLLLAAVFSLAGPNTLTPFVINVAVATALIWAMYRIGSAHGLHGAAMLAALVAFIFAVPVPPLVFAGQEHTLQVLLTIVVAYQSARMLAGASPVKRRQWIGLLVCTALLTMTRYEGLALMLVVCALFAARRRFAQSGMLLLAAVVPPAVYGVISVSRGCFALPNSVLLKTNSTSLLSVENLTRCAESIRQQMSGSFHIWGLLVAIGVMLLIARAREKSFWRIGTLLSVIFLSVTTIHISSSPLSWFYRYEAYLVALGILALIVSVGDIAKAREHGGAKVRSRSLGVWAMIAVLAAAVPLLVRGAGSLGRTVQATRNIYEQQYQMARFVRRFYQGQGVAANDIGAINYYADIHCLDLWGLADIDVARATRAGTYGSQRIRELSAKHATRIAIVYAEIFGNALPVEWHRVGQWTLDGCVVCNPTVSFYAVDPAETDALRRNLAAFALDLPRDVAQSGEYLH